MLHGEPGGLEPCLCLEMLPCGSNSKQTGFSPFVIIFIFLYVQMQVHPHLPPSQQDYSHPLPPGRGRCYEAPSGHQVDTWRGWSRGHVQVQERVLGRTVHLGVTAHRCHFEYHNIMKLKVITQSGWRRDPGNEIWGPSTRIQQRRRGRRRN